MPQTITIVKPVPVTDNQQPPDQDFSSLMAGWAKERAIAPGIFALSSGIVEDTGFWEPQQALGWDISTQYETRKPHSFSALWAFYGEDGEIWQAKPERPRLSKKNAPIKYESPKGKGLRAFLPAIDPETISKIALKHDVFAEGAGFWATICGNPEVPLILTEGPGKSLALLSAGHVAIALTGVNGGYLANESIDGDSGGGPKLIESLEPFVGGGRRICLAFDSDRKADTIKRVQGALAKLGRLLEEAGAVVSIAQWDNQKGACKGVDDLIAVAGAGAWEHAYKKAISLAEWRKINRVASHQLTFINKKGEEQLVQESEAARILADMWGCIWTFKADTDSFWGYSLGRWVEQDTVMSRKILQARLADTGIGHRSGYVNGVYSLLKGILADKGWADDDGMIPFTNGVFIPASGEFKDHDPSFGLTWQLPYAYNPLESCQPIIDWLRFTQFEDEQRVQLLRAYLKAIVMGRTDLQRFLELTGPGGTGKSTWVNLAVALIGPTNCHQTTLKRLETNRFETAEIYRKKLVYVGDSERYGGEVTTLKGLTGGDYLPYERKHQRAKNGFLPCAMVVLAANEPISSADHTSGLQRRKINVPFTRAVDPADRRNLIQVSATRLAGDFAPYLPGLMNWVLSMPDEDMVRLLVDTDRAVPGLRAAKSENLMATNPLAAWLDDNCLFMPGQRTQVGVATKIRVTRDGFNGESESFEEYRNQDTWLYPNYVKYCSTVGSKPISIKRFGDLLIDLCLNQLKQFDVVRAKSRDGAYFGGLVLRTENHTNHPRPIGGEIYSPPPDEILSPPAEVESVPEFPGLMPIQAEAARSLIHRLRSEKTIGARADIWRGTQDNPVDHCVWAAVSNHFELSDKGTRILNAILQEANKL